MWENVKNLLSKKHKHNFNNYINEMDEIGYNSYYQVLNAKDYGIPQNRERVFTISIRKDIDNGDFKFPEKQELKIKLKDLLEDKVDEKYYLSEKAIKGRLNTNYEKYKLEKNLINGLDVHPTILARYDGAPTLLKEEIQLDGSLGTDGGNIPTIKVVGNYSPSGHEASRIIDPDGIAPTIKENHGTVTAVLLDNNDEEVGLYDNTSSDNFAKGKRDYGFREEYGTLKCTPKYAIYKSSDYRIRKLTPKECYRLMGFKDDEFEKAEKVNSNTQLYKQAGNSIVVNVLVEIFRNLLKEEKANTV